ncbi:hypothetical protein [Pseudomonas sp. PA27(2017)]|uniref:hypothetical protein n=1 Tax=Pseudomonas sp. PA27(2017) TaxID=1932112 RepID=UPI001115108C|nr:hypothetical protein [Pseudomonas sp. PA27(2017)]
MLELQRSSSTELLKDTQNKKARISGLSCSLWLKARTARMAKPSAAPLLQLVILGDVEIPVADKADHADGRKHQSHEGFAPVNLSQLQAIVRNDRTDNRHDDGPQQTLARGRAYARRQIGLVTSIRFDPDRAVTGVSLVSRLSASSTRGMNN